MNLGQIRVEIRERLGEDVENFWSETQIIRAINEAIVQFNHHDRWPWLVLAAEIDLPTGTNTIELLDDVDYTRHYDLLARPYTGPNEDVAPTDDRKLYIPKKVQVERMPDMRHRYTTQGPPLYYCLDHRLINTYVLPSAVSDSARAIATQIIVAPAADHNYLCEFRFYRNTRELTWDPATYATDDLQVPDLPIQYHNGIVSLATGSLWLKELNGGTKAQEQFNMFQLVLDQARKDKAANADDEFITWGGQRPRYVRGNRSGHFDPGADGGFGPNGYGYLGWPAGQLPNT